MRFKNNTLLTFLAFILSILGLIGPGFWDIKSPNLINYENDHLTRASLGLRFNPNDIDLLVSLLNKAEINIEGAWCLFVIGHYSGKISYPDNIPMFLEKMRENNISLDWAICAFAKEEISCLEKAIKLGGKIRVGFENSLYMPNGEIAPNNHSKVKAVNEIFNLS